MSGVFDIFDGPLGLLFAGLIVLCMGIVSLGLGSIPPGRRCRGANQELPMLRMRAGRRARPASARCPGSRRPFPHRET